MGAERRGAGPLEREKKEVDVGVEVLVESPELTIKDPAHSAMGRALQGLVITQAEEGVRMEVWLTTSDGWWDVGSHDVLFRQACSMELSYSGYIGNYLPPHGLINHLTA